MRIAAIVFAALAAAGCASRQTASTELGQTAAPVNYEKTVTSYFDLTTRTPLAQRKLQFDAPESTRCRILGNVGGSTGWVVPVTYEITAPATAPVAPARSAATTSPVLATAPAPKPAPPAKGKAAKGKKGAQDKTVTTASVATPTVVAAAVVQAPPVPAETNPVALENVSVTGRTRYFFWFDHETINAVTKRMDICP